jgi:hypothetical protein
MRSGFCLPGLLEHGVAHRAGWQQFGFLAQSLRLFGQAFFKGFDLLETASLLLHGAAPLLEWAGAQPAFSSPINAPARAVMDIVDSCYVRLSTQIFGKYGENLRSRFA